jgi:DNA mismatch repair ATPase MutL
MLQDMFYNMLPRRRAFKPGPEEHNLLQDVLQRYAIYKAGSVGFTLKRQVRPAPAPAATNKTASFRCVRTDGLYVPERTPSALAAWDVMLEGSAC